MSQIIPPYILGIAGGTASGKTTLAKALHGALGADRSRIIFIDSYYRDQSHLPLSERARVNFDHPDAFEFSRLIEDLHTLKSGGSAEIPTYDFAQHARVKETTRISAAPLIIVEGILTLHWPELRGLFNHSVFVDAPAPLRFERRMNRDIKERGRTSQSVRDQWTQTVEPMHQQYCEPSRHHAGEIVTGTSSFTPWVSEFLTRMGR